VLQAQKLPMALRTVIANLNAGRHTYVSPERPFGFSVG
jgi:hypothetical protein